MIKNLLLDILIVAGLYYFWKIGFIEIHPEKIKIIETIINFIKSL